MCVEPKALYWTVQYKCIYCYTPSVWLSVQCTVCVFICCWALGLWRLAGHDGEACHDEVLEYFSYQRSCAELYFVFNSLLAGEWLGRGICHFLRHLFYSPSIPPGCCVISQLCLSSALFVILSFLFCCCNFSILRIKFIIAFFPLMLSNIIFLCSYSIK